MTREPREYMEEVGSALEKINRQLNYLGCDIDCF
jgi:hypothetical protein